MKAIGNIIWFVFGGFLSAVIWCLEGCIWCITVVGIPVGKQCFKFAKLSLFPFGKEITYGGHFGSVILNIIWMILSGIPMAIVEFVWGCVYSITIVGIPFGKQHFKLAKLALMPFGAKVE